MEKDLKEELLRVRAREKRYRNTAEAQIASLQAQLETMKEAMAQAENCGAELERSRSRQDELEKENALLKEQLADLKIQKNRSVSDQKVIDLAGMIMKDWW